jgi:hypothetical protein
MRSSRFRILFESHSRKCARSKGVNELGVRNRPPWTGGVATKKILRSNMPAQTGWLFQTRKLEQPPRPLPCRCFALFYVAATPPVQEGPCLSPNSFTHSMIVPTSVRCRKLPESCTYLRNRHPLAIFLCIERNVSDTGRKCVNAYPRSSTDCFCVPGHPCSRKHGSATEFPGCPLPPDRRRALPV